MNRSSAASSNCRSSAPGCASRTAARCWIACAAAASRWPAMTTAPRRRSRRTPPTASASASSRSPWRRRRRRRRAGMQVIAGAPNIVRGGSHSGNVAAADLVATGAVDAFASDYVPASLVEAAFQCAPRPASRLPAGGRNGHGPAGADGRSAAIAAGWRPGCAPTWCGCGCMRAARCPPGLARRGAGR